MNILQLLQLTKDKTTEIDAWFESEWAPLTPQFYFSCDIRHSGHKIGIVDTNLFPAGFNNLCPSFSKNTSKAIADYLKTYHPHAKKIILFGEDHTRNKFYLKNLERLQKLILDAGFETRVAILGEFMNESVLRLDLDGLPIDLYKLTRDQNFLFAGSDFKADIVISNNDFSAGVPSILQNISEAIIPSSHLGWHRRKKDLHFSILNSLIAQFAKTFEFDPWILAPISDVALDVNVQETASLEILAQKTELLLDLIKIKYKEYEINDTPYVYLKNNIGTYGLGLLPVFSGEEVLGLNRKKKNKLMSSKGNIPVSDFLLQEGIYTVDSYSEHPIEPVIYGIGKKDVGGFFRVHESKNDWESLNSPGMNFTCLCLHKLDEPHESFFLNCSQKEMVVNVSRLLVRFAALAVAMEGN